MPVFCKLYKVSFISQSGCKISVASLSSFYASLTLFSEMMFWHLMCKKWMSLWLWKGRIESSLSRGLSIPWDTRKNWPMEVMKSCLLFIRCSLLSPLHICYTPASWSQKTTGRRTNSRKKVYAFLGKHLIKWFLSQKHATFFRIQKFFAHRNSVTPMIGQRGVLVVHTFRSCINWPLNCAHRIEPHFKLP